MNMLELALSFGTIVQLIGLRSQGKTSEDANTALEEFERDHGVALSDLQKSVEKE